MSKAYAHPLLGPWDALVAANPQAAALLSPNGKSISRGELDRLAEAQLEALKENKVKPGTVVVLSQPNGPDWLASFIASLRLEAVCLPIDPDLAPERFLAFCRQSEAAAAIRPGAIAGFTEWRPRRFRRKDIALGKATSGSSGAPETFYFTSAQLAADGRRIIDTMGIMSGDINLGLIPWGHSYGLGNIVAPLLLQGTVTTWCQSPLPREIAQTAERCQATVFPSVPTLLRALLLSDIEPKQLATLRLVISAGARLPPETARNLKSKYGIAPRNFYGSSETGGICYDADGTCALTGRSVGLPMPGVSLSMLRGQRFRISSDAVHTYGNRGSGKLGSVIAADCGELNDKGELVLLSRRKAFAKIGGKRISLTEIEHALRSIPSIQDAYAIESAIDSEPSIAAAIETELSQRELQSAIRAALPAPQRPKRLVVFSRFPVTARGKIDTIALRKRLENGSEKN